MAAFTKNTIFVKIWEKLRQNGGKIAFWPWFSPKLTNFRNFCKPCHFFNIYRSVSCKSLDNRDLSGKNDEWWLKISFKDFLIIFTFVDFFSDYVTLSIVNVKKASIFIFGWTMVLDLLGFIWITHRISVLGPFGQPKIGSSKGCILFNPFW